ncbi:hypothetical protein HRJ34_15745 [Rhizorhabdus wittichii]|uniref:Uncharacterized protein n=1 Tax=Rhizorhabdus wittichii TaxID=160791 RepID=A0A975CYU2_9SPHN|nr:hypothetical protein [Rhizorhabdus wittichii]QTH19817.1 hypothetical protein HRJ34_15745 [Rhizorhabdus wittichii]
MSVTIFAALAAFWLTGMIPIAAFDACEPDWDRVTWAERMFVYWSWPLHIYFYWEDLGELPPYYAPWGDR